jgi:hypothetical protein
MRYLFGRTTCVMAFLYWPVSIRGFTLLRPRRFRAAMVRGARARSRRR